MNNNLYNVEKNLRSIAKRYENVKYSVGLAVLFLMKGTNAFSDDNKIQELEKQKDILTDVKKEKVEVKVKETKKVAKTTQKLKASWANMQFGANDLYSNFFVTPKTKVEKTSIVKNEKTVLVASADNGTSLPMLAKITSDIEETSTPTTEEINTSKENLRNSVGNLQNKIDTARKENSKEIEGLKLELVQLMEQGNQVVKSPWSSWQFGANYFYDNWGSAYKGRGDKKNKYPFEGIYARRNNSFERYISPLSPNYSKIPLTTNPRSASTTARSGVSSKYGLSNLNIIHEPVTSVERKATVTPRIIEKNEINIPLKEMNTPELPDLIKFRPIEPDIVIPAEPALPPAPGFQLFLGADSNGITSPWASAPGTKMGFFNENGTIDNRSKQNIQTQLRYTLNSTYTNQFGFPTTSIGVAFKMWADEYMAMGGYKLIPANVPRGYNVSGLVSLNPTTWINPLENLPDNIYFNSYNFSFNGGESEYGIPTINSTTYGNPNEINNQRFFVGGSRFIEIDNQGRNTLMFGGNYVPSIPVYIPQSKTVHLAGPLTLGLVSQENGIIFENKGRITDEGENEEQFVKDTPDVLTLRGPLNDITVKKSKEGFLGYKVGIVQVAENSAQNLPSAGAPSEIQPMTNSGIIDFRGSKSIGMYVYLYRTSDGTGTFTPKGTRAQLINKGLISLSGEESYGMKVAAYSESDAAMLNDADGTIELKINGQDKANNSIGMAIMKDDTIQDPAGATFPLGKAVNKGIISLTDIQNSVGAYVNIASNIKNDTDGKILIDSQIEKVSSGKQAVNIGMRADGDTQAEVINKGSIGLLGNYGIGMLTKNANLTNTGTINSTNIKNGIGIVGIDHSVVKNSGAIKLLGTGQTNNIGILLKDGSNGTIGGASSAGVTQSVEVSGDNSTGILVSGESSLQMAGNVVASGNSVTGIVVDQSDITLNGNADITVDNSGNISEPIGTKGSYGIIVKKGTKGKFIGTDTNVNIKIKNPESVGLYSEGELKVKNANIIANDGAINFFSNNGTISVGGGNTETGQKSLLFYTSGTNAKILINGPMTSTIKGGTSPSTRGTAFYYIATPSSSYGNFNAGSIQNYFNTTFGNGTNSTLTNLTLRMEEGSRLFVASNVQMNLSDTDSSTIMNGITDAPTIQRLGNYKNFMLHLSKLKINQAVNLDDTSDFFNQLEIANSSIENENLMRGSQNRQVAMAQENIENDYNTEKISLINKVGGEISLTGEESTGIYAKRGKIINEGKISVGNKSTAIYLVEDNKSPLGATTGATVLNASSGEISVGESSTGVYYNVSNSTGNTVISGGIQNEGKITSYADNVLGMVFDSPLSNKVFKNNMTGSIELTGDKSIGMYATGTGSYIALNEGAILLGNSINQNNPNNPNVGMYTDKLSITLRNNGKISVGKNAIGMYGYNSILGGASSLIVEDGGIGIYSRGGGVTLNLGSKIKIGKNKATGIYYAQKNGNILNEASSFEIGESSYGIVVEKESDPLTPPATLISRTPNVYLSNQSIFLYSKDKNRIVTNETVLTSTGDENYGIYSAGKVENNADINFENGVGNIGVMSIGNGTAINKSGKIITVGQSNGNDSKYSIGMVAGIAREKLVGNNLVKEIIEEGNIINQGTIRVTGNDTAGIGGSIGMYAVGKNSIARNQGTIKLAANGATGMYLDEKAIGYNDGLITTEGSPKKVIGVVVQNGATLWNNGTIHIDSPNGYAIVRLNGGIVKNYGTIVLGSGADKEQTFKQPSGKAIGGIVIKEPDKGTTEAKIYANGVLVTPETISSPIGYNPNLQFSSEIGMYIDTLRGTNPIMGLQNVTNKADLIIGTEATSITNSKYIKVNGKILEPYNNTILRTPQVTDWNIYSSSLTWIANVTLNITNGTIKDVYMAKRPYIDFAGNEASPVEVTDTYNFLDGLEQKYGVEKIGTRENKVFQKLNSIGNNEEILLFQAVDEMMGHQYANTQQRIEATGNILDKEFNYLRSEWSNPSKDSNKIKTFGTKGEYKTNTAGVIDYQNNAYGVAYVHEDETVKLGESVGWYAGIVHNTFKFKDIGNSKEEQLQAKLGIFKSVPFDHNNSLNWTISGDIFAGYNKMNRRFLVVDEVFNAKGRYHTYGVGVKNEISKEFRLSEGFSVRPYAALGLEYGRVSKIREKSGEMKLEVKANDYFSVKPEIGTELAYKHLFGNNSVKVAIGVAYENELGKVANGKNKAKVAGTDADYFNIRGEKEDRTGNVKTDLNIGWDNQRIGVTANIGYDTKGHNVRGGVGLRVIF